MRGAMNKLSRLVARRRWVVLGVWGVLLLASLPFMARQTEHLTAGGFEAPGSGSLAVADALSQFPGVHSQTLALVFDNPNHDKNAVWDSIDAAVTKIEGIPHISVPPRSLAFAGGSTAKDTVLLPLTVDGKADVAVDAAVTLRERLAIAPQSSATRLLQTLGLKSKPKQSIPLSVHVVGQQALWAAMQDVSKADLEKAETSGFPIVLIVLLAIFGSVAAAFLPLSLGVVAVVLTGAAIFFLSQATRDVGLRDEHRVDARDRRRRRLFAVRPGALPRGDRRRATPDDARETAMRTSGLAVAVSGVTVIISLAGLFLIDSTIDALDGGRRDRRRRDRDPRGRDAAPGGAARARRARLRARPGDRSDRRPPASAAGASDRPTGPTSGQRWTNAIMRRPVVFAVASAAVMLVIAVARAVSEVGDGGARPAPEERRDPLRPSTLVARELGPGRARPDQRRRVASATAPSTRPRSRASGRRRRRSRTSRRCRSRVSRDGHSALVTVTPKTGPESAAARGARRAPARAGRPGTALSEVANVQVGGVPAENKDFTTLVSGSLWKLFLFVLLFSYLVLLVMLRSVLLPLKAIVMNVLSVAAAYGVLVVVFQFGWTDGLIGFDHLGYVNALTPPLLLAIVFGLSMDYEVFLLSRIRERYQATGNNRTAVAEGLAASAKTISSAALIMVLVFAVFALTGLPQVKEIGVGLSVAILLDATLVRLILVPATMELMGTWNWWLPGWLGKLLPDLDFEGERALDAPPSAPLAE